MLPILVVKASTWSGCGYKLDMSFPGEGCFYEVDEQDVTGKERAQSFRPFNERDVCVDEVGKHGKAGKK